MKILFMILFSVGFFHSLYAQQASHTYCATLCNYKTDSMTIDEIISCGKVTVSDPNFQIVNFFFSTSADTITFFGINSDFSDSLIKSQIKSLKKGDKINFDIKLANKDGSKSRKCSLPIIIK